MSYSDKMFNIVTAFETIYFWPDIYNSFREVYRILGSDSKSMKGVKGSHIERHLVVK
jgi:ubiquinone/menaquinone biosynthesis C-methylase UbiE